MGRLGKLVSVLIVVSIFTSLFTNYSSVNADTTVTFEDNDVTVAFEINTSWDKSVQAGVTVTNNGDTDITDWRLTIGFSEDTTIDSIWNATIEDNVITPDTYNKTIEAGQSVTFGYVSTASQTENLLPSECTIEATRQIDFLPTPTQTPTPTSAPTSTPTPTVTPVPTPTSSSQTTTDSVFPYAIFANNLFTFKGWKSTIYGDVYSGTDVNYNGSELDLYGTLESAGTINADGWKINIEKQIAPSETSTMPDWSEQIKEYANIYDPIDEFATEAETIVLEGYYYTDGDLTINATGFDGNAVIVAKGDITYNVDVLSTNGKIVLYSEEGDITINGTDITLEGIVYAPNGTVKISANNTTINGRIVCDKFEYEGSTLVITASDSDLDFIYNYPKVTITTNTDEAQLGDNLRFAVTIENNDNNYDIKYSLNEEEILLPATGVVETTAEHSRTYTMEAYIILDDGSKVVLARAHINVQGYTVTPTPTPTEEVTPTPTPVVTTSPVTVTPTPAADIDDDGEVKIVLNTDQFVETSNDYFFYVCEEIDNMSGLCTERIMSNPSDIPFLLLMKKTIRRER